MDRSECGFGPVTRVCARHADAVWRFEAGRFVFVVKTDLMDETEESFVVHEKQVWRATLVDVTKAERKVRTVHDGWRDIPLPVFELFRAIFESQLGSSVEQIHFASPEVGGREVHGMVESCPGSQNSIRRCGVRRCLKELNTALHVRGEGEHAWSMKPQRNTLSVTSGINTQPRDESSPRAANITSQ